MDLEKAVAAAVAAAIDKIRRRTGTVVSFTASKVNVTLPGTAVPRPLSYLKQYTPTNGDIVQIDCSIPDSWLVLGKSAP